jgi:hypothetical protein
LEIIERLGQGMYQNRESWSSSSIEPNGADNNHSYVDQKKKDPKQEQQQHIPQLPLLQVSFLALDSPQWLSELPTRKLRSKKKDK